MRAQYGSESQITLSRSSILILDFSDSLLEAQHFRHIKHLLWLLECDPAVWAFEWAGFHTFMILTDNSEKN